jgi:hypothetical protein
MDKSVLISRRQQRNYLTASLLLLLRQPFFVLFVALNGDLADGRSCLTNSLKRSNYCRIKPLFKGFSALCLTSTILSSQRHLKFPTINSRSRGCGKSGNPASFAGFPSSVGKVLVLDFSTERLFPYPFATAVLIVKKLMQLRSLLPVSFLWLQSRIAVLLCLLHAIAGDV